MHVPSSICRQALKSTSIQSQRSYVRSCPMERSLRHTAQHRGAHGSTGRRSLFRALRRLVPASDWCPGRARNSPTTTCPATTLATGRRQKTSSSHPQRLQFSNQHWLLLDILTQPAIAVSSFLYVYFFLNQSLSRYRATTDSPRRYQCWPIFRKYRAQTRSINGRFSLSTLTPRGMSEFINILLIVAVVRCSSLYFARISLDTIW